jgi:hypothetical protein
MCSKCTISRFYLPNGNTWLTAERESICVFGKGGEGGFMTTSSPNETLRGPYGGAIMVLLKFLTAATYSGTRLRQPKSSPEWEMTRRRFVLCGATVVYLILCERQIPWHAASSRKCMKHCGMSLAGLHIPLTIHNIHIHCFAKQTSSVKYSERTHDRLTRKPHFVLYFSTKAHSFHRNSPGYLLSNGPLKHHVLCLMYRYINNVETYYHIIYRHIELNYPPCESSGSGYQPMGRDPKLGHG